MNKVSFNDIKSLFNEYEWDVGYIDSEGLLRCGLSPLKYKYHPVGEDFSNDIFYRGLSNTIILIKIGHTFDYTHYEDAYNIMSKSNMERWSLIYTNFKEAAILAGLGVRAKNSLIYSYKFGFDCHIAAVRFEDEIVDLPTNKRVNKKFWSRCEGCDDCAKNCPVGAIHNKEEPYWLNSMACGEYIAFSDDPNIPSIKKFWHENVHPEVPKEVMDGIKSYADLHRTLNVGDLPWDNNGYSYDGQVVRKDGEAIHVPFCRECTAQPRCSKWEGKYPYEAVKNQDYSIIKLHRNKK